MESILIWEGYVDDLNERVEHGKSLAQRSLMIRRLILGIGGVWMIYQLTPKWRAS